MKRILKRIFAALALAALILTLCACAPQAEGEGSPSPSPVQSAPASEPSPPAQESEAPAPADFPEIILDEDSLNAAVPDFLDGEQQLLYRRALCVYSHLFGGDNAEVCRWEEGDPYPSGDAVEHNGLPYTKATGRYAAWEDFDAMVHSVFTDDFWTRRNAIQRGELFLNIDGALHFVWASRGMYYYTGNVPDTFELVSRSEDEIVFTLTGHYSFPWPKEGESPEDRDRRLEQGWEYTIDFPMKLVRTEAGWRFDQFHGACADQEGPPQTPSDTWETNVYFDRALTNFDFAQDHSLGRYIILTLQVPAGWTQSDNDFQDEDGGIAMKLHYLTQVDPGYVLDEGVREKLFPNSGLNPEIADWPAQAHTTPQGYECVLFTGLFGSQSGMYGCVRGDGEHILFFSAFAAEEQTLWDAVDSMQFFF